MQYRWCSFLQGQVIIAQAFNPAASATVFVFGLAK